MQTDPIRAALEEFVNDVESTGGLTLNDEEQIAPAADQSWTDIAQTYINACAALDRKPLVNAECPECGSKMGLHVVGVLRTLTCEGCGYSPDLITEAADGDGPGDDAAQG